MAVSRKVYDDYLEYVARCDADGDEAVPFDQYRLMVGPPAVATEKPTNPKDAVGIKKTPFSVLPTPVLVEAALGMAEGALKYGRHNYRAIGVRTSDRTERISMVARSSATCVSISSMSRWARARRTSSLSAKYW